MNVVTSIGRAFLRVKEGDVLRAYRDPVGIWTIGPGLTAASGVITPRAGMTITQEESDRLLSLALDRNYEPAVRRHLGEDVPPHAHDGGTSFHFNTGAIARATWVGAYHRGDSADCRRRVKLWNKGGGRVLPGLVTRRREEANIILDGRYPSYLDEVRPDLPERPSERAAVFVVHLEPEEFSEVRRAFSELGYDPGQVHTEVLQSSVRAFQGDHGLAVDGRVGIATLTALQRRIDARRKGQQTGGGAAPAVPGAWVVDPWLGVLVVALFAVAALVLLYRYRDVVAAKVQHAAPGLARRLRSF